MFFYEILALCFVSRVEGFSELQGEEHQAMALWIFRIMPTNITVSHVGITNLGPQFSADKKRQFLSVCSTILWHH